MNALSANIGKYGYGVVVFHPQDFVKIDGKGKFTNVLNESAIKDLARLVDSVLSKHIHIISFSKLTQSHYSLMTPLNTSAASNFSQELPMSLR